jgi:ribosomal-protein-serine acetyltransferase
MSPDIYLSDGPVAIRPYRFDDAPPMFEAARESIADIYPWMHWCHPDYTLDECIAWVANRPTAWESGNVYNFAIVSSQDDTILGGGGLSEINYHHRLANLFYWVRSSRARQGVASTATRLIARFGFTEVRLNRIEIVAATTNHPSIRAAEKAGATREGLLRNRILLHGQPQDAFMFSLIPQDLG